MNTHTDEQLKKALAKLLPDVIEQQLFRDNDIDVNFHVLAYKKSCERVKNTELLHLCWRVEISLNKRERASFAAELEKLNMPGEFHDISASWQQRVIALCKVKGVELI